MTLDEARRVLGVGATATAAEVRDAYRRLLRTHHPDVAGPAATSTAARVIEAYAVVRAAPPVTSPPVTSGGPDRSGAAGATPRAGSPPPPPTSGPPTGPAPADTITLAAPTRAVFEQLCEAADVLGDLSYLDRQNAILETIVTWDGWPASSLLVTLVQRGDTTLAQCELESLDGRPGPPIEHVVAELRRIMAALAE